MIISVIIMVVIAAVLLAYVLEPVIRAHVDRVEIDAASQPPPVPDFWSLLDDELDDEEEASIEPRQTQQSPEPAEHRS
ncbi:hypothetical protein BH23CHL2_BH23CHL2_35450 [soil metagenome]